MTLIKTILYLTTFVGIVGYLETGKLIFAATTAIGILLILKTRKNE